MIYLDFALVIYAQRKSGNSPYGRKPELREESWGLLKVLLSTTYAYLEEDLATLAHPTSLSVNTYSDDMARLYQSMSLKWSSHYPECERVRETVYALGKVSGICAEMVAVNHGDTAFVHRIGQHSNILTTINQIKVNL